MKPSQEMRHPFLWEPDNNPSTIDSQLCGHFVSRLFVGSLLGIISLHRHVFPCEALRKLQAVRANRIKEMCLVLPGKAGAHQTVLMSVKYS